MQKRIDRSKVVKALMLCGGTVAGIGTNTINPLVIAIGAGLMAVGQAIDGVKPSTRERRNESYARYKKEQQRRRDAANRSYRLQSAMVTFGPAMRKANIPVTEDNVEKYMKIMIQYIVLDKKFQTEGEYLKEQWGKDIE